jgi:hypothetical protein
MSKATEDAIAKREASKKPKPKAEAKTKTEPTPETDGGKVA